tara:strand:- start:36814 stop:37245 length:432 start_codon:yes stop_codon:yes gene_type:complete
MKLTTPQTNHLLQSGALGVAAAFISVDMVTDYELTRPMVDLSIERNEDERAAINATIEAFNAEKTKLAAFAKDFQPKVKDATSFERSLLVRLLAKEEFTSQVTGLTGEDFTAAVIDHENEGVNVLASVVAEIYRIKNSTLELI